MKVDPPLRSGTVASRGRVPPLGTVRMSRLPLLGLLFLLVLLLGVAAVLQPAANPKTAAPAAPHAVPKPRH